MRPRSEGGRHTVENLITLCTAHHRAVHRGELVIEGTAAEPRFQHADGTPYGQPVAAPIVDNYAKVFAALHHLAFREREVNAVLAEFRADGDLRDAPANLLLREALCGIRAGT